MTIQGVKGIETHTIKSFRVKLDSGFTNGHDFCELIVDESNHKFTTHLYGGETYSYSWESSGEDFIQFLIDEFCNHNDHLFDKLENHKFRDFIDNEKTAQNMKKLVLAARYNRNLDEDEARDLFDEVESFSHDDDLTESHFYDIYMNKFEKGIEKNVFSDEPGFEDFVERKEDYRCKVFCEKVAPILGEVLKQEYTK